MGGSEGAPRLIALQKCLELGGVRFVAPCQQMNRVPYPGIAVQRAIGAAKSPEHGVVDGPRADAFDPDQGCFDLLGLVQSFQVELAICDVAGQTNQVSDLALENFWSPRVAGSSSAAARASG